MHNSFSKSSRDLPHERLPGRVVRIARRCVALLRYALAPFVMALTTASMSSLILVAGCFPPPPARPDVVDESLARQVRIALDGHEDAAMTYAGLYAVLAERFESGAYATTAEAAAVSGRAAEILSVPGALNEVVDRELQPLLGTPQPLNPTLRHQAATRLQALSAACREVSP